ncbi:MAG: protein kinase family protein [Chloroflexota bacterium]
MTSAMTVPCSVCSSPIGEQPICGRCGGPVVGAILGGRGRYRLDQLVWAGTRVSTWRATDRTTVSPCLLAIYQPLDVSEHTALASGAGRLLALAYPRLPVIREMFAERVGDLFAVVFEESAATALRVQVASSGPLAVTAALRLANEATEALSYLASVGLGHEDVRPELLGLDPQRGAIFLTLTLPWAGKAALPGATPRQPDPYLPPELAPGAASTVSATSASVYALAGCVSYALTGWDPPAEPGRPFHAAAPATLDAGIVQLLARCRAADPNLRPALPELRHALTATLAGRPLADNPIARPGEGLMSQPSYPGDDTRPTFDLHNGVTGDLRQAGRAVDSGVDPGTQPAPAAPPDLSAYGGVTGPTAPWLTGMYGRGTPAERGPSTPLPNGTPTDARETMLQTGRELEARGDLHGALLLYRQARQSMAGGDEAAYALDAHIDRVEARIASLQMPTWGGGASAGGPPDMRLALLPPVQHRPWSPVPWMIAGVLGLVVLVGGWIFVAGTPSWLSRDGSPREATRPAPTATPAARMVEPAVPNGGAGVGGSAPAIQTPAMLMEQVPALRAAGDFDGALKMLDRIKGVDPSVSGLDEQLYQTHMAYAKALLERGDHDRGLAEYGAALALRPGDADAQAGQRLVNLVRNRDRMEANWGKNDDVALEAAEANFAIDPDWKGGNGTEGDNRSKLYALLVTRADRLWAAGSKDAARATLERARTIQPDGPEAVARFNEWFATPTPVPPTPTPRPIVPTPAPAPPRPAQAPSNPPPQQAAPQAAPKPTSPPVMATPAPAGPAPARVVTPLTTGPSVSRPGSGR